MKKSSRPFFPPDGDSEVPYAHPGTILKHVVEYIVVNRNSIESPDMAGPSNLRPSGFSEDVGRAVMLLMSENRQKEIYQEITEVVSFCERDVLSHSVLDYLDNKIMNFGHYLTRGDERECLMYFATISEMVLKFSSSGARCMITRVMHEAKENMFMYADMYESYIHIDAYCKHFLKEYECRSKKDASQKVK